MEKPMTLILASASPRRRELMRKCGMVYDVCPVSVAEKIHAGEAPAEMAVRLACEKARSARGQEHRREGWVLAADTVVADGGTVLGKPRDQRQAVEYLMRLRGREHQVITGVCLLALSGGEEMTDIAVTTVRMRRYALREAESYAESGEALDKAGAYAIQDPSFRPVEALSGCYTNVVGLPLCRVYPLLERAGESPRNPLPEGCRTGRNCGFAPETEPLP
jgi:septum formation protein